MDLKLLQKLLSVDSPSGNEDEMADLLEEYMKKEVPKAKIERAINNLIVLKGKPTMAVFAHIDTVGFMATYDNLLTKVGNPTAKQNDRLQNIKLGIEAKISEVAKKDLKYSSEKEIEVGTYLSFASNFKMDEENKKIHSAYLDNRLGIMNALELLKICDNIAVAFTTKEEHYGNGARVCAKIIYEKHKIDKILISDITWTTKNVKCGNGPIVSLRDDIIPHRRFIDKILKIANSSKIKYQMEVESAGRSDSAYIDTMGYPIEWCFIGVGIDNYETSQETCSIPDFDNCVSLCEKIISQLK